MKKHIMAALLVGCAVAVAGCSGSKKETEAPKTAETTAVKETEAVKETTAPAAETEAAAAETEAAAVETEAAAVETEAEKVVSAADETEAEKITSASDETEAEKITSASDETEAEKITSASDETEADLITSEYDETETEAEPVPVYDAADYLVIEDEDYKDITVEAAPAQQATDEEVAQSIEMSFHYLEDYDELVDKVTEGTVKEGDLVNIDYVGTMDGEEFDGGSAEGYELEIGSGSFIEGFEDGLIGKEIGSEVDLELTFPEDYGNEELDGKDVNFHVTLNYVAKMPEVTDEIAEKISDGEYDNVDDFEASVREDIQSDYDAEFKEAVLNEILGSLVETYTIEEYPEENVQYYMDQIMEQYINPYADMYGMSVDDFLSSAYGMSTDEFIEKELRPTAEYNLSQEIILSAIAEKEGMEMSDEELEERLQTIADSYGVTIEELTDGMDMEVIRKSELQQKVLDMLFDEVTIVEVEETEESWGYETEAETTGFETEAETAAAETEAETAAAETETEADKK